VAFNSPLDELTYSLLLISALRLDPIYVARIPAAPFAVADDSTNRARITQSECPKLSEKFSLLFWREGGHDFFEARVPVQGVP
jgi:hypothetical protein